MRSKSILKGMRYRIQRSLLVITLVMRIFTSGVEASPNYIQNQLILIIDEDSVIEKIRGLEV